jgi:hypothetical protein
MYNITTSSVLYLIARIYLIFCLISGVSTGDDFRLGSLFDIYVWEWEWEEAGTALPGTYVRKKQKYGHATGHTPRLQSGARHRSRVMFSISSSLTRYPSFFRREKNVISSFFFFLFDVTGNNLASFHV